MSSPLRLNFSKFPEGGLILVILVLGILLSIFGGEVQRPKMVMGPDGHLTRAMEKDASGQETPAFVKVNNFFNAETLTQIAKDTSFFGVMAVGVTIVIITAGIDLSVGSVYALAAVGGAMFMNQFGSDGGPWSALGGVAVTLSDSSHLRRSQRHHDRWVQRAPIYYYPWHHGDLPRVLPLF